MADKYVAEHGRLFGGTAGSTDLGAGDLVYFDGTDWEKADATDNTKHAEAVVVFNADSGELVSLTKEAILVDTDAPYTQGASQFLSASTAGAITSTRPTGANNLVQVVGYALSTEEVSVALRDPYEVHMSLSPMTDGTAVFSQGKDYTGVLLGAVNEAAGYSVMVPQNAIGLQVAYLWWAGVGTALDGCDTYTIDVSAAVDDETDAETTDGIAAAALTVAANDLNRADVSAAFDACNLIEAGNVLGIDVDKAAEGTAGDDALALTCHLVFLCV